MISFDYNNHDDLTRTQVNTACMDDEFVGDVAESFHEFLEAVGFEVADVIIVLPTGDIVSSLD